MANESRHTGGCMCGEIRYQAKAPPQSSTICYCVWCRHSAGAVSVAWLTFRAEDFAVTKGQPASYASSPGVVRTFCPRCGTSLTYKLERRKGEIDVTTGSTDRPEDYPPDGAVFPSHKVAWDVLPDRPTLHDDGKRPESWLPGPQ